MMVERQQFMNFGSRKIEFPIYFPSISSVKTALSPDDYLRMLASVVGLNNQFLVSAYDLEKTEDQSNAKHYLERSRASGAVVLMDSGNYESYWKDSHANWRQEQYHSVLKQFPCDLAFGFDEQFPPHGFEEHVELIFNRWQADQAVAGDRQIIPIIHAAASELPELCRAVASQTGVTMLAVAERKLGDGIHERAKAVQAIRQELNTLDRYVVLHLLGTGNPISIAMYSAMGADSFDGLEWCQTVVDHDTALLYHISQADFFSGQTSWGGTDMSFQAKTLAHNLEFFVDWMHRLRDALNQGRLTEFFRANLPERAFKNCARTIGWSTS